MNIIEKGVWIRLAGNAKRIKAGGKEGWRCFLSKTRIEIPSVDSEISLVNWKLSGHVSENRNFIPGTYKFAGSVPGDPVLVAWIDMFGDITIQDGVARIELVPL